MLILFFGLTGCSNGSPIGPEPGPDPEPKPSFIPTQYESNGVDIGDYKIVIPTGINPVANYAASELQAYIQKATNKELEIVTDDVASDEYEIILGYCNRNEVTDSGIDFTKLGDESFVIKNIEKDLLIATNNSRGMLYGVYSFLEDLGYRFYTAKVEKIPEANDVFVPNEINHSWMPAYYYRDSMFESAWDPVFAVKSKINGDFRRSELRTDAKYGGYYGYAGGDRYLVHTFKYLLPYNTHYNNHPDWYSKVSSSKYSDAEYRQPCFSNFDSIDEVMKSIETILDRETNAKMISVSQNDGGYFCECDACKAGKELYGASGVMIRYINEVARRVKEKYPDRDIKIDTLAYDWSLAAPKGDIKIEDNVIIRFCTEMCPFHDGDHRCDILTEREQHLLDWEKFGCDFSVWTYPKCLDNLFNSWPNYYELKYNNDFYFKHGVVGMYQEGYPKDSCEFSDLKCYVLSKIAANPDMSNEEYEYHICDFLQGYYGEGWTYIRKYIQYAHDAILENLGDKRCLSTHASIDDLFDFKWNEAKQKYDMKFINRMNDCWESALDLSGDEITYAHIEKSSLHWTLIELYVTFDDRFFAADYEDMFELEFRCRNLYEKLKEYGTTWRTDRKQIDMNVTDFTAGPNTWFIDR